MAGVKLITAQRCSMIMFS